MQPINYTIQTPDYTQGIKRAFELNAIQAQENAFLAQAEKARQEQQAMIAQQEENRLKQQELMDLSRDPTSKKVQEFIIRRPEFAAQFKDSYANLSDNEKKAATEVNFLIKSGLEAGKGDVVLSELERRIDAAKNSGDAMNADRLDILKQLVIANPNAALLTSNAFLASTMDPDKFATMEKTRGEESRAAEEQPFKLRKMTAEAVQEELNAKFAPDVIQAELGLRRAQTSAANASAAASSASAAAARATADRAKAEANQITSGIIPVEKRPEAESKFRDEYFKRTAVYQETKDAYGRVLSANENAAGDLALVFAYMKMLDPGSVVREGEFASAANAAGVPERIRNIYNNVQKGEILNSGQRKMFKGQAKSIYDNALKQEEETRKGITRIAKGYGLNTENIFFTPEENKPQEPNPPAPVAPPTPTGFRFLGVER
jgi:hypothetical protein